MEKLQQRLCELLNMKEATPDALMAAIKTMSEKGPDKVLSQSSQTQTPANGPLVKLVCENRSIKVSGLVTAGLITPAVKTAIEEQYMKPEQLALSLSGGWDDGFDFMVKILAENTSVALGEKTAAQLLELANTRAKREVNPLKDLVDRDRKEAGLDE